MTESRPPLPPFDRNGALAKVQAAEDAWNSRDPQRVSLAYTEDSAWRKRDLFLTGRPAIVEFLTAKWERELDYVLRKSLWAFREDRIAVRFQYEWHDDHRGRAPVLRPPFRRGARPGARYCVAVIPTSDRSSQVPDDPPSLPSTQCCS